MNIRLYYPNSIVENTTALLSKEHTHYIVNVMRLKRGSKINFYVINPPAMKSRMRSKVLRLLNLKDKDKTSENLDKIAKKIIKKFKI